MSIEQDFDHLFVQAGSVRLHVLASGPEDGPLVILLHGFPELSWAWRALIPRLAAAGMRVIAPDQRGYGASDKPAGVESYRLDALAADVLALADAYGARRVRVVGHDWGGSVAWWLATRHADRIERMAILSAPHPAVWLEAMKDDPEQRDRSRYVQMLRLRWVPELMIRLGGYRSLDQALASGRHPPGPDTMRRYRDAWRQPGALTGMINWYRALFRETSAPPPPGGIEAPTLLISGDQDRYAAPGPMKRSAEMLRNGALECWTGATHWTLHDEPERLADTLVRFFQSDQDIGKNG
jgi:epoxide hydrolase 4